MSGKTVVGGFLLLVAGAGVGYGVGYFLTKKRYDDLIDREIQSVKDTYAIRNKEGIFSTPEGAVEALISDEDAAVFIAETAQQLIEDGGYSIPPDDDEEVDETLDTRSEGEPPSARIAYNKVEIEHHNVWADHGNDVPDEELIEDEDISEEAQAAVDALNEAVLNTPSVPDEDEDGTPEDERIFTGNSDHPYIISEWQFMHDGEHEDSKMSLLYFEGDETLVDERETLIPNVEYLVGNENLHHFGMGTRDKNTLYIRNEKTESDYEIIRDVRNFTEVVLGIKPAKSGPLRMREDDQ